MKKIRLFKFWCLETKFSIEGLPLETRDGMSLELGSNARELKFGIQLMRFGLSQALGSQEILFNHKSSR